VVDNQVHFMCLNTAICVPSIYVSLNHQMMIHILTNIADDVTLHMYHTILLSHLQKTLRPQSSQ
jgi:hypothetical protein